MNYFVVDIEATCWDDKEFQKLHSEVIEIGAAIYDTEADSHTFSFCTFVKPKLLDISPFCTKLTGIKESDLADAMDFRYEFQVLLRIFDQFKVKLPDLIFASWGQYDYNKLKEEAAKYGLRGDQFFAKHFNISAWFKESIKAEKRYGVQAALKHLGVDKVVAHRALDDVFDIIKVMSKMRHKLP